MIPNPIIKVLSTFSKHRVRCLLIGGQACIIYGASEFSRDSDFVVFSSTDNLKNLRAALSELKARRIYVPTLDKKYLDQGHACHFRCYASGVERLRVDILSKLRGCDDFSILWDRRFKLRIPSGPEINVINLRDLVVSKKTQRDKDWFMLRRLVDNDIDLHGNTSNMDKINWWLCECRNPIYLIELCRKYPDLVRQQRLNRHLLKSDIKTDPKNCHNYLKMKKRENKRKIGFTGNRLRKNLNYYGINISQKEYLKKKEWQETAAICRILW